MNRVESVSGINNKIQITKVSHPNFKSESKQDSDKVELSNKKTGLSNKAKWGIGIGAVVAAIGIGIALISKKHKAVVNNIEKLCDEKLVLRNLPEKIEWKKAETLEDAVKYTTDTLGIKDIDKGFTLEALNDANAYITDICNLHKGKLYMPTALEYAELANENMLACVNKNIKSSDFGKMSINKRYYDKEFLQKRLKESLFNKDGSNLFYKADNGEYITRTSWNEIFPFFDKKFTPYLDKYYNDAGKLTLDEMRTIYTTMSKMLDSVHMPKSYPMTLIKGSMKRFEENGIKVSIEELSKKTKEEQSEFLINALHELNLKGNVNFYKVYMRTPGETIYHEMGHLQDYGCNLKDLYMKQYKEFELNAITDRFGSIATNEELKNLWENDKEKFKNSFPQMYEFLTNNETQEMAGRVSTYAQSGIGEFIAEFYSQMALVKKYGGTIAEEVEALYKKYKGPMF